jgi:hypothetical protein
MFGKRTLDSLRQVHGQKQSQIETAESLPGSLSDTRAGEFFTHSS